MFCCLVFVVPFKSIKLSFLTTSFDFLPYNFILNSPFSVINLKGTWAMHQDAFIGNCTGLYKHLTETGNMFCTRVLLRCNWYTVNFTCLNYKIFLCVCVYVYKQAKWWIHSSPPKISSCCSVIPLSQPFPTISHPQKVMDLLFLCID